MRSSFLAIFVYLNLLFFILFCYIPVITVASNRVDDHLSTTNKKTVVYKTVDSVELKMNIYYPDDFCKEKQYPAIVFFFGGGWYNVNSEQFLPHALVLNKMGMVAILADYRTMKISGVSPKDCISDARSAMRYIRMHSDKLNIDSKKIAASGGSAGGHLAIATAVIESFDDESDNKEINPVPDALVLFNPVLDNGPVGGYAYNKVKEYYKEFSPAHNIKRMMPPTLVMIGTKDKLIPVETILRFQNNMNEHGNICDVYLYSGQGHGFFNYKKEGSNKYYYRTLDDMVAFLKNYNFINDCD